MLGSLDTPEIYETRSLKMFVSTTDSHWHEFGLCFGTALGAAMHNVALGIGIGIALGTAIVVALARKKIKD